MRELERKAEALAGSKTRHLLTSCSRRRHSEIVAHGGWLLIYYERKRWEVVEFVETMRSDGSLVMTLRLKRKRAADEEACTVKKAPNQNAQR